MIEFSDAIEWPNGKGFTPCSREYAKLMDARNAVYDANVDEDRSLSDLSPEDYEIWNVLDNKLLNLQANGHLGKSVRY